ncbi:PRD domain-containing protein [Bacillus salipaludis]|uniref:PRD domain-containing protein n=1 Tax=Bacillus salipaludis TaxID=2547811 RepID=A0A4R5VJ84_9BACI|nr:PRD domain-containing protein [Bacillus salipaludis]MDQ6595497.1 PRD domain-containing protein [Bacillus salipaludis]TDK57218.1 PRD domain-containing protein [Bacillus salipaludis]
MYITTREKEIIELIIKTSGKHTALTLATYLNVSVRTIQRNLKSIEKVLDSFDLQLVRNTDKGLVVEGKNEQVFRLIQYLMGIDPIDQTPQEKELLLLIALIQEESYKIQALSIDLGVSAATLTAYLDELTGWLGNFNIQLTRKRGVGVELIGTESSKRKALASFMLLHFNEELIEGLFLLENGESHQDLILYYFHPNYLLAIDRVVNTVFSKFQQRLADSDYIGLIVHICITLQRAEAFFFLEEEGEFANELTKEYNLISEILRELESLFSFQFKKNDILFLAGILKGSKLQAADILPYDSVVLSKKIKNLIQHVSSQLHVDLTKDFSLHQGLLAHMEPSLFRLQQKMGSFNPLKEEIKRKYPVLFMAVKNSVETYFKEIKAFPEDEIAFIVLHFGSALVMKEEDITIKALVVCPTGIGTSKMLASRIKKEIAGIDTIEIKSIKEMQQQENFSSYDLIISTVKLPFTKLEYMIVSPLLSEENIETIKNFLKNNIKNITEKKSYLKALQKSAPSSNKTGVTISGILQELQDVHQSIQAVLNNFCVYRLPILSGHEQILKEMVKLAENKGLLTNADDVMSSLKEREEKGGLGIPDTGMALFHCRNENVKKLIFQITHLKQPIPVKGMDGNDMYMKNLLLMLAPEELSVREQEIVSLISTSLIENNEAILIFSSSNEEMIRTRLEAIFLDYLQTNIIKE